MTNRISPSRYSRHIALPEIGDAGQLRIERCTAAIVGLGGLGSPAALYLAAAGVGRLILNDFDKVDVTNLQRQILYDDGDVGVAKTAAAAGRLARHRTGAYFELIDQRLPPDGLRELAARCDVVLDGSDNFGTRFAVNEACVRAGTPLVSGAAIRFEGQLAVFRNDLPDSPCYRCLYEETDESLEDCAGSGVLGPLVGVIGSFMAVETLKVLTGAGQTAHGRLLSFDALNAEWRSVSLKRDPACPVCASRPRAAADADG
ncbi:MAG: HesA/MoeB/ThiF family protein [Gammaproteobacteria bacterium]|nr:HesA/MoeB/ThiF family protein [Gammaproteobacteria bacterium]